MFTGRQDILERLRRCFDRLASSVSQKKQRIFVLYGLGGTGKTQIMLRFVDEFSDQCDLSSTISHLTLLIRFYNKHRFDEVFYIDASMPETLQSGFEDIARYTSAGRTVDEALRWLSHQHKEWLLLIDNADDPSINLRQYFPRCAHGNIIMTSRNQETRVHAPDTYCSVAEMQPEDATEMLLNYAMVEHSDHNRGTCDAIGRELGYLALAVAQAGAYIARSSGGLNRYLHLYQRNRAELMRRNLVQRTDDYKWSVYTTWEMNLAKLSPTAVKFLQLCAFLHYDGISKAIFEKAGTATNDDTRAFQDATSVLRYFQDDDGTWNDFLFFDSVDELASYSLINVHTEDNVYSIHPLVHAWARDRMKPAEFQAAQTCALHILALAITDENTTEAFTFRRTLLPHLDEARTADIDADVAAKFQQVYKEASRWIEAEKLQRLVVNARTEQLGSEHVDTLRMMAELAMSYKTLGRWKEAEESLVVVLKARKKVLGDEHKDTLKTMEFLAIVYSSQGRQEEATALLLELVETSTRVLGSDDQDTLSAITSLATLLAEQYRWAEAEAMHLKALETQKRVFGEDHPYTLTTMSALALTLWHMGHLEEATSLTATAMEASKKQLGQDHHDTLDHLNSLAVMYSDLGRWQEATVLQLECIAALTRMYGREYPDTLTAISNLAVTYHHQGRWRDAEELVVEALEARRRLSGEKHPDTLTSVNNLSMLYFYQGRWKEGEAQQEEAVESMRSVLGEDHPGTLTCVDNLSTMYWCQGRLDEAEAMQTQILEKRKVLLPAEHPDLLLIKDHLASTYRDQGRLDEAEALELEVVSARTVIFGEENPVTLKAKNNLAQTFWSQGRFDEAEALQSSVLEARERRFGREYPDTLITIGDLAKTYWSQGRREDAHSLAVEAVEARRRVLGDNHPYTQRSVALLAEIEGTVAAAASQGDLFKFARSSSRFFADRLDSLDR